MAPSRLRHARRLGAVMAMPDVGMLLHMAPHGNANEQNQAENPGGGQAHDFGGLHNTLRAFGFVPATLDRTEALELAGVNLAARTESVKYRMPVVSIGRCYEAGCIHSSRPSA